MQAPQVLHKLQGPVCRVGHHKTMTPQMPDELHSGLCILCCTLEAETCCRLCSPCGHAQLQCPLVTYQQAGGGHCHSSLHHQSANVGYLVLTHPLKLVAADVALGLTTATSPVQHLLLEAQRNANCHCCYRAVQTVGVLADGYHPVLLQLLILCQREHPLCIQDFQESDAKIGLWSCLSILTA